MMKFIHNIFVTVFVLIYNLIILGGTTYLVFWKNQTGWLYLLAMLFILSLRIKKEVEN